VPNPNPYKARLAQRRPRKTGDLPMLTRVMWRAVLEAEEILANADEPELKLRAIHAIVQAGSGYAKLLEIGEWEGRLAALEAAAARRNGY
jgi:hypothetical protein